VTTPLAKLAGHGQSVWLDYISRELVTSGELERLIQEDNVTGLTSNPTIFQKAIGDGHDYDEQIRELLASGIDDPTDVFLALAISDIQRAADILRPVYERTGSADGFVSLEVLPSVAHDTESTVEMVRDFWQRVDRPNLMVKIPATLEGLPAIRRSLAEGRNINVTLIFALSMHERVIDAYMGALEDRLERGQPLDVHSVASFFVSRVDTAVDKILMGKLAADPANPKLESLLGKAAIANAVLAYEKFEQRFDDARFTRLREAGAHVQRPLWASTSAKNPSYRDVVYAEALIGPDTVDTMPPQTVEAFRDHGIVETDTVKSDYAGAHRVMEELAAVGIDMEQVTADLLAAGVKSFAESYDELLREISIKLDGMRGGYTKRQHFDLGASTDAVIAALRSPQTQEVARRIWARDPDLWKPGDAAHAAVIGNRLGWLDVIDTMRKQLPELLRLAADVVEAGWKDCVLLGMGGSSLCPEVLRASFGSAAGQPVLHVLDTTDPVAIRRLTDSLDVRRAGFVASSKSGKTLETLSHLEHFWELTRAAVPDAGRHFITITDPDSALENIGRERAFRNVFTNPPDIGGRYSALSFFGLVPAAIAGIDVERLLDRAAEMRGQCGAGVPGELNCGLALGTVMGLLHESGRDKVTIMAPPAIASYSLWAEQLIAESTGKEAKGIIPIGSEPIGHPSVYGDDRLFVALRYGDDAAFDAAVGALRTDGQPVISFDLTDLHELSAEFFRWEFATAVAGASLRIDPFDEPNVQESKDNTAKVLARYESTHTLPEEEPAAEDGDITLYGGSAAGSLDDHLRAHLDGAQAGDYVALMAYVTPDAVNEEALQRFRVAIRNSRRVATTFGFGPRFLHSTGQLHKGGPNTGVFIQITADDAEDVDIPGQPFSFSVFKQAQAAGDLQSLRDHGRRVIRLHIRGDVTAGIARLTDTVLAATAAR
jgi:transaldolase / glucose-6-phosphate isomerase